MSKHPSLGFLVDILLVGEMPTVRTQEKILKNTSNTCGISNVCTRSQNQTHSYMDDVFLYKNKNTYVHDL